MVRSTQMPGDFQERLHVINDTDTGVTGIIAIHSTALGPAAGGCRFWPYPDMAALTTDAVRLARGMSYKNALAGLPFGGGKAVLNRPAGDFDREAVFRVFARAVDALDGAYVTAEDVGTGVADMEVVRARTRHVAGLTALPGKAGGDPSPWTALGVFESMKAAADVALGADLKGLRVAVQGTGHVGAGLCRLLTAAGATLVVADVDTNRARALADSLGAAVADPGEILFADVDILAPCALGAVLNAGAIPRIRAKLVCGGANNQLETPADGDALFERGIAYAPDYVVNAGGIINVAAEYLGESDEEVRERVLKIAGRLRTILDQAALTRRPSHLVADELAQQIIANAGRKAA